MPHTAREPYTPVTLQQALRRISSRDVLLMLTDNTHSMLTVKPEGETVTVRAHRMFLDAPEEVIRAIGDWIAGRRRRRDTVQEFIDANQHRIRPGEAGARRTILRPVGKVYDLRELAASLNERLLEHRSNAEVTWGRKLTRRVVRAVQLGSYDPIRNVITISRRLDQRDVPRCMVEFVLYHEMLHEVLGIGERPDGRREIHGSLFRLMEQTFPDYEKARAYERTRWGG